MSFTGNAGRVCNDPASLPHVSRETQVEQRHLQTCLVALEKIMAISGPNTPIFRLAQNATLNRPQQAGGGDY